MREVKTEKMLVPLKIWDLPGLIDDNTIKQASDVCGLSCIHPHVALMPDAHFGAGSSVGTVIPVKDAIPVSTVGVDLGCGMLAAKTSLRSDSVPKDLKKLRLALEKEIPAGRTDNGGAKDRGSWGHPPARILSAWKKLEDEYNAIVGKRPNLKHERVINQLGTLGGGNHYVELCLDLDGNIWIMLHSGSRGIGNKIGSTFTEIAKATARKEKIQLPSQDLAYLKIGTKDYDDYIEAASWAQKYAYENRQLMLDGAMTGMKSSGLLPSFNIIDFYQCHHNYISPETHYGNDVFIIRKGAVRAQVNDVCIIPGSMGAKSYIVRGKGNPESFNSCSHGAGRSMSRTEAKRKFTVSDLIKATEGVECLKTEGVLDEIPSAYKSIDEVLKAEADLVDSENPIAVLKQFVCLKGEEEEGKGRKRERELKKEAKAVKKARRAEAEEDMEEGIEAIL